MDMFLKFFSSDAATAVAWFCSVAGFVYALVQRRKVSQLNLKCEKLHESNIALTIKNTRLEQNINSSENSNIHDNYQDVQQNGENNFNQGVIKGDFNYNK